MNLFGRALGALGNHNEILRRQQQQQAAYESNLASVYGSWDATAAYAGTSASTGSDVTSLGLLGAGNYTPLRNEVALPEPPEPAAKTFLERLRFEIDTWIKLERN